MKKILAASIALVILCSFGGCGIARRQDGGVEKTDTSLTDMRESMSVTEETLSSETAESVTNDENVSDTVTAYQFLNLICGNAETLTFEYTLRLHETNKTETGVYYRSGEQTAAVFTAQDADGNPLTVREVEKDGIVFYIMDATKTVKRYRSPAADFLLDEMMKAAGGTLVNTSSEDGGTAYEYAVPFEQDASITLGYRFLMKNGALDKMIYSVDGMATKTYTFKGFTQEEPDKAVFDIPADYREVVFDYAFTGVNMPPWWEHDGLSDF